MNGTALQYEEQAIFALRSLYANYGYAQYKMSKFEEYDLYVRNKDFLISDSVITFTDRSGKLKALKPDVTLSILKNGKDIVFQRRMNLKGHGIGVILAFLIHLPDADADLAHFGIRLFGRGKLFACGENPCFLFRRLTGGNGLRIGF